MKDIFLITPPFTQLNTPYPATAYLKGFLNTKAISSFQMDLGIAVILEIFSHDRLREMFALAEERKTIQSTNSQRIYALREDYCSTVDQVIAFLQGKDPTLARLICTEQFLPEASRFDQLEELDWAFGSMGMQDRAKHLATLYLEDLSDFIVECIDPHFGFSRYAERLGRSANTFDPLYQELLKTPTWIDEITLKLLDERLQTHQPRLVAFSVPFPGNLYSAFRCAQYIRQRYPDMRVAMGGGFPNTELRSVSDTRVFDFFHYITLDDGELPVELLIDHVKEKGGPLKRTFLREANEVVYKNDTAQPDYKQKDVGTPDYSDLPLDQYISVIEVANPMHSLWSDGRWNKLTMAHGCYWGKCTFCDISLDYIKLYEPIAARLLVDRMEALIDQTGERGFHFVDEAAPPALMREVAFEIVRRKLVVTWWTNIRFEKSFTRDLCVLLQASGCIAVSGGLEVASDRLLKLIDKGVTVEQVAQVTSHFTEAGIMVHAYLMYGYPTQTIQETVDSMEMVRQLFELNLIQSGFWHQFALTAHSPVGLNPQAFGVHPVEVEASFAYNDVQFMDDIGIDHQRFSEGLKKSLFNYMHGLGFEVPLQNWFDFKLPKPTIRPDYIHGCLARDTNQNQFKPTAKIIWLGGKPTYDTANIRKKGKIMQQGVLSFHNKKHIFEIALDPAHAQWLLQQLESWSPTSGKAITLADVKSAFLENFEGFEGFWYGHGMDELRENGLLAL